MIEKTRPNANFSRNGTAANQIMDEINKDSNQKNALKIKLHATLKLFSITVYMHINLDRFFKRL